MLYTIETLNVYLIAETANGRNHLHIPPAQGWGFGDQGLNAQDIIKSMK